MTNTYTIKAGTGNATVGEKETLFLPSTVRPGAHGVMLLHAAGNTYASWSQPNHYGGSELAALIALAGFPCLSIEMGGSTYANDVAVAAIDNSISYLASASGVPSTKIHVMGASMGGGAGLRYASLNPSKVVSVTGIFPMVNIDYLYQNNINGLRTSIAAAWGVTYPAALPAGANLYTLAAAIAAAEIPTKLWYDNGDVIIRPQDVIDMGTATDGQAIEVTGGDAGHSEGTLKNLVNMGAGRGTEVINHLIAAEGA